MPTLLFIFNAMLACVLGSLAACLQEVQTTAQDLEGTYRYAYPHNTQQLVEDHYIVLELEDGALRGWYYGTSDDFDSGREGYFPGFFVADMQELAVTGDSIRFTLRLTAGEYRGRPVPRGLRLGDAAVLALPDWRQRLGDGSRTYFGQIDPDSVALAMEGETRVFYRVDTPRD